MPADGIGRHTPTLSGNRIVRALLIDDALLPHVSDAIGDLTFVENWYEINDAVDDIVAECKDALDSWYLSSMFIGQVASFLGSLPQFWLPLDGTSYDRVDYPELYAALDSQFIDDADTFTLPDIQDLFLAAAGNTYALGDTGGEASHQLVESEIPGHTHTYVPVALSLSVGSVGAPTPAGQPGTPTQTGSTGGDGTHENRPPFIALTFGIFAGRD